MTQPTFPNPNEVYDYLDSLGTTADEVAATVIAAGIRDDTDAVGRSTQCPIAQLLRLRFTGYTFALSSAYARLRSAGGRFLADGPQYTLPQPVAAFVYAIDEDHARRRWDRTVPTRWPALYADRPVTPDEH